MSPRLHLALLLMAAALPACTAEESVADTPQAPIELGPDQLRPLSEVLELARRVAEGKVIGVELESDVDFDDGVQTRNWVYEIEILTAKNHVVEVEIDAVTGKLLEVDGAPWPAGIPRP